MEPLRLIKSTTLIADSSRRAQYQLQLYELSHGAGYVIAKQSGPAGFVQASEWWYRPSLELADKKYAAIVRTKTNRINGRRYEEAELAGNHI